MNEYSKTFFSLLAYGNKLEIYDKRYQLTVASYPNMDADAQETIRNNMLLPDDLLNDILEDERTDDISKVSALFSETS